MSNSTFNSVFGGGIADFSSYKLPPHENLPPRIVRLDNNDWYRVFGLPTGPRTVWKLSNAKALLAKIEAELKAAAETPAPAPTIEPARNPVEEASAVAARWFAVAKRIQKDLDGALSEVAALREAGHITKERLSIMRQTERKIALQAFRDSIDPKSLRPGLTAEHLEVCADCGMVSDAIDIVRETKLCTDCVKGVR